jgi:hypothetical protein
LMVTSSQVAQSTTHSSRQAEAAQREAETALDAVTDLTLQLRLAEEARTAAAVHIATLEEEQVAAREAGEALQDEAVRRIARMSQQLQEMSNEVAAAEAAANAAAALAEAAVAAAEALADASKTSQPEAATCSIFEELFEHEQPAPAAVTGTASRATYTYANASRELPQLVTAAAAGSDGQPKASQATLVAAICCGVLAIALHLRGRQLAAAEAQRAAQLAARLREACFARENAEQSLALLESELQRRMKQLGEVQQRATDAGKAVNLAHACKLHSWTL